MKLDAVTATWGAVALAAAGAAVWQWTAPAPEPPRLARPEPVAAAPDRQALAAVLARVQPAAAPPPRETPRPAAPRRDLRLIGVMETDQGRVAVIAADGRTIFLRPGETADGVELVALDQGLAVVRTRAGERRLSLGG